MGGFGQLQDIHSLCKGKNLTIPQDLELTASREMTSLGMPTSQTLIELSWIAFSNMTIPLASSLAMKFSMFVSGDSDPSDLGKC